MSNKTIPIARPTLGELEQQYVRETLQSGWVTQGPRVAAFEQSFASYVQTSHASAVSNCTTALYLALKAVGVQPGDAVITVSHSFIATANCIRHCGAEPVFVDIDEDTMNMCPDALRELIQNDFKPAGESLWLKDPQRLAIGESPWRHCAPPCGRLAAILVVHQLGMPADLARILPLAKALNIPVVEDAACAIGSQILWNGEWQPIGRPHADIACFSFHPRKVITTGDGGMLTTRHKPWDDLFRLQRQHGMGTSDMVRHAAKSVVFEEYHTTGFNFRLTDIQAAVGCAQMERLPDIVDRRRALGAAYHAALAGIPGIRPPHEPAYARSNWQSYSLRLDNAEHQLPLMQDLLNAGISSRRGVMCAHRERPYAPSWSDARLAVSEHITDSSVIVPLFPEMSDDEVQEVANTIRHSMQSLVRGPSLVVPKLAEMTAPATPPAVAPGDPYRWPREPFSQSPAWKHDQGFWVREMPESLEDLAADSRWPAFFPSPICLVTTRQGEHTALEKVVGASIVNRFPYTLALSFCARPLSDRHHVRRSFMDVLEAGGEVAVQFISPGPALQTIMQQIGGTDECNSSHRLASLGLDTRPGRTVDAPVFGDAYLVYEGRLVKPGRDYAGKTIFPQSFHDAGSHRVYFLEITAIQLRRDIATGERQISWTALPRWQPAGDASRQAPPPSLAGYQKGYSPTYRFPAANTVAFEADEFDSGMAIKLLPPQMLDQIELDDDKARWPCFFPSSLGMITAWDQEGTPNLMPCGSTTIISRHPLIIAPCVSYAAINRRYAPRASLEIIRRQGRFGCGVAYLNDQITQAIRYAGNVSLAADPHKIRNAGLGIVPSKHAPILKELPIHFDCDVIDELRLGTHVMFLGEVKRIHVRDDVSPENPLSWSPWASVVEQLRAEAA